MVTRFALADGIVVNLYTCGVLVSKCTCLSMETLVTQTHSCTQIKKPQMIEALVNGWKNK